MLVGSSVLSGLIAQNWSPVPSTVLETLRPNSVSHVQAIGHCRL